MSSGLPLVAIIGRPNVGKSTLFNRLVGERVALVSNIAGLTRDRNYARAEHGGRQFIVTDTGGYETDITSEISASMRAQTMHALEEADRIVMLCDSRSSNDPVDVEIIEKLRKSGRKFFLAVNKCENEVLIAQAYADFSVFGLEEVFPISALHGGGLYELMDAVVADFPEREAAPDLSTIRIAIVGKPNVGKSTLVNRLVGEKRVIASPIPGTTRDSVDTEITVHGQRYTLIDTAGIRRRSKVEQGAEILSVFSSLNAIERAEIVLLLIDATEEISQQDAHIAGYILERGRAAIIVLNKWDLVEKDNATYGEHLERVREAFNFMKWAPIATISAETGQRAPKLWDLIRHASTQFRRTFPTSVLNLTLKKALAYVSPPTTAGAALRIKYACQTGFMPPAITLFVNDPKLCHFSYKRYLENQFRQQLQLDATPLFVNFRKKSPPKGWERGSQLQDDDDARHEMLEEGREFSAGIIQEDGEDYVWIEPGSEP